MKFICLMMSKRMRGSLPYLQMLAKCKPKVRKVLIEHGPSNLVLSICECCRNVLKETVPLTKRQKQHLSRYKNHLKRLGKQKDFTRKETTLADSTERWGKSVSSAFTTCFNCVN